MTDDDKPTFLSLIHRLTRETSGTVQRENGQEERTQIGLLEQLRAAMFGGMEGTGGSSAFGSKPPIDAGAYDLLNEITTQAADVLAVVDRRPTPFGNAEDYVKAWAELTSEDKAFVVTTRATVDNPQPGRPSVYDRASEYTAYQLVEWWSQRIEDFFNPPKSKEIPSPCPRCHERYVVRIKDGEMVRSSALSIQIDRETGISSGARCAVCAAKWERSEFEQLAREVGAAPVPELMG